METPTILFLGESPPVGTDPSFLPFDCASGTRLARVLGLRGGKRAVVELLRPRNLFSEARGVRGAPAWDPHEAEASAAKVWAYLPRGSVVVCLGERVLSAVSRFNERCRVLAPPYFSGTSTLPTERRDFRRVVLPALVQLGPFVPGDFDLDDESVRVDLATALLPEEPARAMVALDPRMLIDNVGYGSFPTERWREWALQVRIPKTHLNAAERLRRRQPYFGSDRLYQHWSASERRACQRALYEAEANAAFDRRTTGATRLAHLDQVDRDILAAEPEDRLGVLLQDLDEHIATLPK